MKIEKLTIRYSTTVPIAAYGVNDKFDWEITLLPETGEAIDMLQQTASLKSEGDAIVTRLYPHIYESTVPKTNLKYPLGLDEMIPPPPPVIDISKEKEQPMLLEDIISSCTEIDGMDGLESYRKLVESQPLEHIKKLFDNKLKELNK